MIASSVFSRRVAPLMLRVATGAFLSIAVAGSGLAATVIGAPWVASTHSKARLVSGTVDLDGEHELIAGVQLRMDEGWKTYWTNPGDSGVPPSFDWSGSKNLKSAEVLYPAPQRFADANGTAIGYEDSLTFPVKVTPEQEGQPVELKLAFDYGLCKDLCIPNSAKLSLAFPAIGIGTGDGPLLAEALQRVPKPAAAGVLPSVEKVDATLDGANPELVIEAAFAANATDTDLFIDGGETYVPVPKAEGPIADGKQRFVVAFASPQEAAAIKGKPLTLTLVSDQGSTATVWTSE
jgi:DsbC/DsbD-like thiol-disulfide interchange protein